MNKKPRPKKMTEAQEEIYVMRIADLLSDDPILLEVIGSRFKMNAHCDRERRRITYEFRAVDDVAP